MRVLSLFLFIGFNILLHLVPRHQWRFDYAKPMLFTLIGTVYCAFCLHIRTHNVLPVGFNLYFDCCVHDSHSSTDKTTCRPDSDTTTSFFSRSVASIFGPRSHDHAWVDLGAAIRLLCGSLLGARAERSPRAVFIALQRLRDQRGECHHKLNAPHTHTHTHTHTHGREASRAHAQECMLTWT